MKEYTIIGTIKYKNNLYETLLDDDHKYFFLKVNENEEYEYITLNELVQLTKIYKYSPDVMLILGKREKKKKKIKLIPKILIGIATITLSASLINVILASNLNNDTKQTCSNSVSYVEVVEEKDERTETEKRIDEVLDSIAKENESNEIEKDRIGISRASIYDSESLDKVIDYQKEDITYNTLREQIKKNRGISDKYKEMYLTLINNLQEQYPTMDLRIMHQNLQTLKIVELDELDMKVKALSINAYACYRIDENVIYTVKDYDYKPGTWEYQVIIHEMCHPLRSSRFEKDERIVQTKFETQSGNGKVIGEALNSLLAVRSYNKDEKDIAYQLQSNMIEVMVDCTDNYTYQDYVEHNLTYFEHVLNEQNHNQDAMKIFGLIELQYNDYHDDKISVDQEEFYELYDYISKMYYDKHITPNMSKEELFAVEQELVNRIMYDVPEDYNIDTNHFMEYFEIYCQEKGILLEKTL